MIIRDDPYETGDDMHMSDEKHSMYLAVDSA